MAIEYVEIDNLLYEVNENGERVLVRSTDSSSRAYLRFTNKTSRPVDIWWRDFRGAKHHYVCLSPGTFYDINSFISHPWEFTDAATNERFVVNNTPIYRAPANIGGMMYRTNWNITISVRSLRETALMKLAEFFRSQCSLSGLDLPQVLETELQALIATLHRPNTPEIEVPED